MEGKHGEQISAGAINFHDETFEGVEKYQFVQQEAGRCILNVVPSSCTFDEAQVKRIEKYVQQKFQSALTCKVEIVQEIEMSARGKYKMVIKGSGD